VKSLKSVFKGFEMNENIVLGADIGGSHITASLVDIQNRQILSSTVCRREVNSSGEAAQIVSEWSEVIRSCFGNTNLRTKKIGIAMPGPVDYEIGFCYIKGQNKYESLYGCNLKELLGEALEIGASNIRMINDAAGFLAGEMFIGAGRGFSKVVGLTLGTGLGSAFYENGSSIDADLWHSPFLDGKAEDYISAPWLLSAALKNTGIRFDNVRQMAEKAESDIVLQKIFQEFGNNLGLFLAEFTRRENPEMVVLGGNVSKAFHLFSPGLEKLPIPVRVAQIGESAALVGAATLWDKVFGFKV
jgi:glucokinase